MKTFLFSFALIFSNFIFSQDSIVFKFTVVEKDINKITIENARIYSSDGQIYKSTLTNSNGIAYLTLEFQNTYYFTINHPNYDSQNVIHRAKVTLDTINILVSLSALNIQNEKEVVVVPKGVPQVVYGSQNLSVADFEVLNDGRMLLLVYPKRLEKESNVLLYDGRKVLNNFRIPGKAKYLTSDYRGDVHVVCEEQVYALYVEKSSISVAEISFDYFEQTIEPIIDTVDFKVYYTDFIWNYPEFNYILMNQEDSTINLFANIHDDVMMEMYRSEYKYSDVRTKLWAKNKELQTGIDAPIWVGASVFVYDILYEPLFSPMFLKNDTVILFDFYQNYMKKYDLNGICIDSTLIEYHLDPKKSGWQKNVIQDKITGEIYTVFNRAGYIYLGLINLNTGKIDQKIKLNQRYPEKIELYNRSVYYVYRPFESKQKKYLYKEILKDGI